MKIGIISDIHVDINEEYPVVDTLARILSEDECEGLILAGDIYNKAADTLENIDRIEAALGTKVWFVPGNHDMWDPDKKFKDAWEIYDEYKARENCICGKTIETGDGRILAGSLGWYDYTMGHSKFTREDFAKKNFMGRTWQDSLFVRWGEDDETICRYCLDEIKENIKGLDASKVIAVTHMLSAPEFSVDMTDNEMWQYFNAFLGSAIYGDFYEEAGISCGIMGHVHYRKYIRKNNVDYRCACLGYESEWETKDLEKEIRESIQYI